LEKEKSENWFGQIGAGENDDVEQAKARRDCGKYLFLANVDLLIEIHS
jgi:hypothetical protein